MPKTTPTPRELRDAYDRGENIIQLLNGEVGDPPGETSIELSYDLQSGGYVEAFDARAEVRDRKKVFMGAVKSIIDDLGGVESVLDAGVGEGTTLWSFLSQFENPPPIIHGSDLCWSRLAVCRDWLARQTPRLNVDVVAASLSEMPYQDNSFDLVYTVHSIEPNRGREQEIIHELFRVAGKYLVLIEP
ncbi:MAG: class I SAM-dependent methyltransferase, partial [Verrucomicrobiales bacterium]|nr:class I SAM-dependent methyltransferase [Verrucomicrobiales bacterium]